MTHEHLTPREAFGYSINRMPEVNETPTGGSGTTRGTPGRPQGGEGGRAPQDARIPPTPERIDTARRAWEPLIERTTDSGERESMRALAEMGTLPVGGGAEVIDPADYPDPALVPFVEGLNNELRGRIDRGESPILDLDYASRQLERLERLIDEGRVADRGQATRLQQTLNAWRRESFEVARGEARRERQGRAPEGLTIEQINRMIDESPDVGGSRFPPDVMEAAFRFKETRERLINRILFKSFEDTTDANRYEINLYAQDNLEQLLGFLSREDSKKYDYFVKLRTAAQLFHTMNVTLVGGKLEEFIREAANINYEHFSLMQQLCGVPEVMRLYEEKYQEILAKNKRIATEGHKQLREEVGKSFRALNEAGLIRSEYEGERTGDFPEKLKEWEVSRALNAGRTFFNITFRAAEHIANGQLEEGGRRYTGFPQEDAVRLMNWPKWLIQRFGVAEPRGGLEFLKRTNSNYFEFLNSRGRRLGKNRITELGGMDVRELEEGGMFGVSGVYSSWRIETMLFPRVKIGRLAPGEEDKRQTLNEWFEEKIEWRGKGVKKQEGGKWVETKNTTQKRSAWIEQIKGDTKDQDELLDFLTPVIEGVDLGLGVLLKHNMLSEKVGYKARQRIWERVSDANLPLMISYLSSIKLQGEDQSRNLIRPVDWNDEQWDEFKKRILLDHAWKMKRVANPMLPEEQRTDLSGQSPLMLSDPENYTRAQEEALIGKIKSEGRKLVGDLADIVFPYVPFMNDVPFELIDYAGPGETFYKRRSGSDLPSFSAAERAFTTIVNSPGGIGAEKALTAFDEIVKGIEQPQGTQDAQERVFPMFSAWAEFIMTRPGQKQMILKAVTEMLRKPTSIAQEFAGMDAESLTEIETLKILENAVKAGILSPDLYDEMREKKQLRLIFLLWALIRDIGFIIPLIPVWQVGKEVVK